MRIGIPGALFYYVYYPMWKVFFEQLDVEVVTSGKTTKALIDKGVREALADACVPVKLFFGHAMALKDKVDQLFIPRIVCLNSKTVYCPKFLALPDMIRHGLTDMPPLIDVRIDTRDKRFAVFKAFMAVGKTLKKSTPAVLEAYAKARITQMKFYQLLRHGFQPAEAIDMVFSRIAAKPVLTGEQMTFALVGYPYIINDQYISVDVVNRLRRFGINVLTPDNLSPLAIATRRYASGKRLFWTFSDKVLRSTRYFTEHKNIDGIIHLSAFGCGPDSIVDKFIRMDDNPRNVPFMSLIIDEHSGEAGIGTRLEAFVDMVKRKKRGE
ncbi:MAG: acyl-CoA dehydratase activase-related protein [Firmicutes bacterium]|nr:acyl-CoA dehydratase activase-related protein [Bacillota bacterium]